MPDKLNVNKDGSGHDHDTPAARCRKHAAYHKQLSGWFIELANYYEAQATTQEGDEGGNPGGPPPPPPPAGDLGNNGG